MDLICENADDNESDVLRDDATDGNQGLEQSLDNKTVKGEIDKADGSHGKDGSKRKTFDTKEDKEADDETKAVKKPRMLTEELMSRNNYRNAKLKNLKVFTEEEIRKAPSSMEKTRRRFWNDKAEQLATREKTAALDKLTLIGIIDVAWTRRKSIMIEDEGRRVLDEENILLGEDKGSTTQKKNTKKQTLQKNLERMSVATSAVESLDKDLEEEKDRLKMALSMHQKEKLISRCSEKKMLLTAAYTELKKAQDATLKAIKEKRRFLDSQIKLNSVQRDEEPLATCKEPSATKEKELPKTAAKAATIEPSETDKESCVTDEEPSETAKEEEMSETEEETY